MTENGSFKDQLLKAGLVSVNDVKRAEHEGKHEKADRAREAATLKHLASAPRYPSAVPVKHAEVVRLLTPFEARFEEAGRAKRIEGVLDPQLFTNPSAQIIDGDLTLDDFELAKEGSNLLVRGNLTVKGMLHQEFRAGGLVVFGRLSARHIVTTGAILCVGDLDVAGTLYGNCTNYGTIVLERASIGTLVSADEHLFSFVGSWSVGSVVDVQGGTTNLDQYGVAEKRALLSASSDEEVVAVLRTDDSLFAD